MILLLISLCLSSCNLVFESRGDINELIQKVDNYNQQPSGEDVIYNFNNHQIAIIDVSNPVNPSNEGIYSLADNTDTIIDSVFTSDSSYNILLVQNADGGGQIVVLNTLNLLAPAEVYRRDVHTDVTPVEIALSADDETLVLCDQSGFSVYNSSDLMSISHAARHSSVNCTSVVLDNDDQFVYFAMPSQYVKVELINSVPQSAAGTTKISSNINRLRYLKNKDILIGYSDSSGKIEFVDTSTDVNVAPIYNSRNFSTSLNSLVISEDYEYIRVISTGTNNWNLYYSALPGGGTTLSSAPSHAWASGVFSTNGDILYLQTTSGDIRTFDATSPSLSSNLGILSAPLGASITGEMVTNY